ncbi:MAG: FtsW/RodA/SpoVE family cell cycle protein, partial [Rhodospirillales bacterium]|nr:FtsW/RodA/SpoVE family cell cycle protein [Rhodospirillales bacterium]
IPGAPFVPRINGATAWIRIGGFSAQPAEVVKILFVLSLAWYLRYRDNYRTFLGMLIPFVIMFVPVALILKQPDLGTAMLFAPALFAMLIAAGARLRHLAALAGLGIAAIALNIAVIAVDPPHEQGLGRAGRLPDWIHMLKPHQEKRFAAMMWPTRYEKAEAFQQITAMRMIGAGGALGSGKDRARTLIDFNNLPEPHNDMIFAVIVSRWGAVGGMTTMALYFTLLASMLLVAARSKDPFARLACVGFAGMIFTQAFINIGMTLGLLPITGITLPFVSYGGSSLVATYIMIGLTLNFAARRPQMLARPSFEYDNADAIFQ